MTPAQWQRIQEVFDAALLLEGPALEAYLDESCVDDPELREEVSSLLRAAGEPGPLEIIGARLAAPMAPAFPDDPKEGTRIGPYRVLRTIGHGGMGVVYLAERADGQFEQQVALKVVRRGMGAEHLLPRFLNERQILARLVHPNIARLYDGGFIRTAAGEPDDGRPYFAMEYVEGEPVNRYCDRQRLGIEARLTLFCDVCRAVQYAQQNLVVHRDLKPSNILVTERGDVKLLDFGIAKLLDAVPNHASESLTRMGAHAMTPEYASPEQVRGNAITTATDVYALGVVLYELLTGRRPYHVTSLSPVEMERVICEKEPHRPSTAVCRVDPDEAAESAATTPDEISRRRATPLDKLVWQLEGDLDTILLKALRKEPERRYASAGHLLEEIHRHRSGLPVQARPNTLSYRISKFVRRHRVGVAATALVVVSLLGGMIGIVWQASVAARERDHARLEAVKAEQVTAFLIDLFTASDPLLASETERPDTLRVRDFLQRGADKVRRELSEQPNIRASMMNVVGDVYRSLGLYDESLPLLSEALRIRRQSLGATHPDIAKSMHSLAVVLHRKGDYDEAEKRFEDAIAIRRSATGAGDLSTGLVMADFGLLLRDVGRFDEAESMLREVLAIQKARLGNEHLEVATTLMRLGTVLQYRSDLDGAETFYRDALALQRELLGEHHPTLAETMLNTGTLLRTKGDYDAAEPLLKEALAVRRSVLGNEHPLTVTALYELAMLVREKGDNAQAAAIYREIIELDRTQLGPDHQYLGLDYFELGITLNRMTDYDGADEAYRQALSILRKALPNNHPSTAHVLNGMGYNSLNSDSPERCEPLVREALVIYQQSEGEDSWRTGVAKSTLGHCLMDRGRLEEAGPLLLDGYAILEGGSGPTRAALERLVMYYRMLDRPEKAAEYESLYATATH